MDTNEIDDSVKNFYTKNSGQNYKDDYDRQHSPRYAATIVRFGLGNLHGQKLGDFGAGRCGFFNRLPQDNEFFAFDGADLKPEDLYCKKVDYRQVDLERDLKLKRELDTSFCFETCEHVGNPFRLLNNIKDATKINGDVYISIPHENMTHPVVYYDLFYPHTNFMGFLQDMALPVMDQYLFNNGWPSVIFKCRNLEWKNKRMRFWKQEQKFRDANLLECTNL